MLSAMNTEFGQRLKQARKAAALTQAQLAKKVGIGQSTIAELEKIGSGSSHTPAIAAILNVSALWGLSRSHGATVDAQKLHLSLTGLSPLARGNPREIQKSMRDSGPIPARTGQPCTHRLAPHEGRAYPRSHGATHRAKVA